MFQFNFHDDSGEGECSSSLPALDTSSSPPLSLPTPWQRKTQTEEEQTLLKNEEYNSLTYDEKWLKSTQNLPISSANTAVQYVWHFDMINDAPRNRAYHHAICKVLREVRVEMQSQISGKEDRDHRDNRGRDVDLHVLDVGTGSGLLALLAAKEGASCVTAIEVESAVAKVASLNISQNGMESVVKVQNGHSMTPSIHIPSPVHLIVTELLDTGLLGEAFIPVLRDAQARGWMREGCRVIPARGRVFGQLVESEYMHKLAVLDPTKRGFGFTLPEKKKKKNNNKDNSLGGTNAEEDALISPFDCSFRHLLQNNQARELSAPFVAWDFDFEDLPSTEGRSRELAIPITAEGDGVIHAVLFWWEVDLDRQGEYQLSSAAGQSGKGAREGEGEQNQLPLQHQDHWVQAFTVINSIIPCKKDQIMHVLTFHNDENVWFEIPPLCNLGSGTDGNENMCENEEKEGKLTITQLQMSSENKKKSLRRKTDITDLFDSERIFQMNSCHRNATISRQVQVVLQKNFLPHVMVETKRVYRVALLGDGPLLPLLVAKCFDKCLDSTSTSSHQLSSSIDNEKYQIIHLEGNDDCQALSMKYLSSNELYPPTVSSFTSDPVWALKASSVNLLCAEPFFQPDAFCKTWGNSSLIRYWLACHALSPFLAPDAQLLPARAVLRIAAVECEALWQARLPCSASVEGLDLSALNSLHSFNKTDSVPLWRYDHRLLSRAVGVLDMDFWTNPGDMEVSPQTHHFQVPVTEPGTCHGLVMWIEYSSVACGRDNRGRGEERDEKHQHEEHEEQQEEEKEEVWCSTAMSGSQNGDTLTPSPHLQGIRFHVRGLPVCAGDSVACTAKLDVLGNDISVSIVI